MDLVAGSEGDDITDDERRASHRPSSAILLSCEPR